jgi:hypothetical protein
MQKLEFLEAVNRHATPFDLNGSRVLTETLKPGRFWALVAGYEAEPMSPGSCCGSATQNLP